VKNRRRFHLLSLGCPKNLVDGEGIATLLRRAGYTPADSPGEAELLIVNTCGFIEQAREQSRAALLELAGARRPGQVLIAAGCYAQRAPGELTQAVPGLDALIGTRHWTEFGALIEQLAARRGMRPAQLLLHQPLGQGAAAELPDLPRVAVQGASAYLKVADGCSRTCAFCAIPLIKGPAVSRPLEAIAVDAALLARRGVREMILIAQDTTAYGEDLSLRDGLTLLLDHLTSAAPEVPWLRLMYAFPGRAVERLAEALQRYPQLLPYLDLPLQHAHPDVLRRMRRPSDVDGVRRSVERLRQAAPGIAMRTTLLVGYPGETDAEFQALLDFVTEMAFDRVGVFTYSHEAGTPAAHLADDVPPAVKEERRARVMELQQPISLASNRAFIGRTLEVLIEGQDSGLSVGRSYRDAPEIDGLVLVQGILPVGEIARVHITDALEYDLVGAPA
jgi:ribosomal protein S12 methylthiotransferase